YAVNRAISLDQCIRERLPPLARDQASKLFSPTCDQVAQLMQDLDSLVLLEPSAPVRQKTSCSRELALQRHLVIPWQTGDAFAVKRLHDFNHERTSAHTVRWLYSATMSDGRRRVAMLPKATMASAS